MNSKEKRDTELEIAEQLIENQNYTDAEQVLNYIIASDPEFLEAHIDLSVVKILLGRAKEALDEIVFVLKRDKQNETAINNYDYIKSNNLENYPNNLELIKFKSLQAYSDYRNSNPVAVFLRNALEEYHLQNGGEFALTGSCIVCGAQSEFDINVKEVLRKKNNSMYWGNTLTCRGCGLTARERAIAGYIQQYIFPSFEKKILLWAERGTLSDYLGGIYNDLTLINMDIIKEELQKGNAGLENIGSDFDLVAVCGYEKGIKTKNNFSGFSDRLKDGGVLLMDLANSDESRERIDDSFKIIDDNDSDILRYLKDNGFMTASASSFWSRGLGYLGESIFITAEKAKATEEKDFLSSRQPGSAKSGKESIVIFANCQGGWFYNKLAAMHEIADNFEIKYIPNFDHPTIKPDEKDIEAIKKCSYLVSQVAVQYPEFKHYDSLPRNCSVIKIPSLAMNVLWPFQQPDPRSTPEPGYEFGRFPYGDSVLNEYISKNISPEEIVKIYMEMDLNKKINLARYLELYWEEVEYMDSLSDIKIYPVLYRSFKEEKTFDAINHPRNKLLWEVFKPIEDFILLNTGLGTYITDRDKFPHELGNVEMPIHPAIAREFGLEWAGAETKYKFRNSSLTFEEYIYKYIVFELIR